jgi:uncharacterized protein HemX
MITKLLASRFAGTIIYALMALAVAGGLYGFFQGRRANTAETLASSRQQTINGLNGLLQQRDTLIAAQNKGIEAISKVRAEDRVVYIKQYAAADQRAKGNDARADQLVSMQSNFTDELAQCRAARTLLEGELAQ